MDETRNGASADTALPLRMVNEQLNQYISKLGRIWVEGQIVSMKAYGSTYYISFRDVDADSGITVLAPAREIDAFSPPLEDGSKIVFNAQVEYRTKRGEVSLRAYQIQRVGVGNLLAQLEELRRKLEAEGIFDASHKKPLPFLPRKVGLITGRDTDAKKDVLQNSWRRWPSTQFEIREIPLQQKDTPLIAARALAELQADPLVDVIVIARGGGSLEDLLPWSDEGLVRAVAASVKPVVSAIGHENDRPLMDYAADVRASTPTDAAMKIVPNLEEEVALISSLRGKLLQSQSVWLANETRHLQAARATLAAKSPRAMVKLWQVEVTTSLTQLRVTLKTRLNDERAWFERKQSQLAALSPYAVLGRGYALATTADGTVIKAAADLPVGADFQLRLAEDTITATRNPDAKENK
jgi:exodeoxyribonuclease VII large subunit